MIIIEKYGPMRTWKVVELDLLERILGGPLEKSMAALACAYEWRQGAARGRAVQQVAGGNKWKI